MIFSIEIFLITMPTTMNWKPCMISKNLVLKKITIHIPNTDLLGFVCIFRISTENASRIVVGLLSLKLMFLYETHHVHNRKTTMTNLLVLMYENATNVVVTIFTLNLIDSKTLIAASVVDLEDILGVVMVLIEAMVNMGEVLMVPLEIAYMKAIMASLNLWPLENMIILLIKIHVDR